MANVVCVRCQDVVEATRKDSQLRLAGLLVMLVSVFVFWPLAIVGFLMLVFGGTKTVCPQCKGAELVPIKSSAGQRVIDSKVAAKMLEQSRAGLH